MKTLSIVAALMGLSMSGFSYSSSLDNPNTLLANSSINQQHNSTVAQNSMAVEQFIVRGAEPFWSITINRNNIIYSTPDIKEKKYPFTAPLTAEGRPRDLVRVYRLNGQPSGTLMIRKVDSCSDSMSDKVYPYSATLILGNKVFDGCAEKK